MAVLIKNSQKLITINSRIVKRLTEELLTFSRLHGKDISILLVDNKKITVLNNTFFGKDQPTNAISFSYMGGLPGEIAGEIIISVEKAQEEAKRSSTSFYERLVVLIIHGLVHILGYDHMAGCGEARRMRYQEKRLLDFVRSGRTYAELMAGQV